MESLKDSLEQKIENPDWKQFVPVLGIYKAVHDLDEGKPSICEWGDEHPVGYYGGIVYHVAALYGTIHLACEAVKRFL